MSSQPRAPSTLNASNTKTVTVPTTNSRDAPDLQVWYLREWTSLVRRTGDVSAMKILVIEQALMLAAQDPNDLTSMYNDAKKLLARRGVLPLVPVKRNTQTNVKRVFLRT